MKSVFNCTNGVEATNKHAQSFQMQNFVCKQVTIGMEFASCMRRMCMTDEYKQTNGECVTESVRYMNSISCHSDRLLGMNMCRPLNFQRGQNADT